MVLKKGNHEWSYDDDAARLYAKKQWLRTEKMGDIPDAKTQVTPYKNMEYMQIINKIREDRREEEIGHSNIEFERQQLQNSALRNNNLLIC